MLGLLDWLSLSRLLLSLLSLLGLLDQWLLNLRLRLRLSRLLLGLLGLLRLLRLGLLRLLYLLKQGLGLLNLSLLSLLSRLSLLSLLSLNWFEQRLLLLLLRLSGLLSWLLRLLEQGLLGWSWLHSQLGLLLLLSLLLDLRLLKYRLRARPLDLRRLLDFSLRLSLRLSLHWLGWLSWLGSHLSLSLLNPLLSLLPGLSSLLLSLLDLLLGLLRLLPGLLRLLLRHHKIAAQHLHLLLHRLQLLAQLLVGRIRLNLLLLLLLRRRVQRCELRLVLVQLLSQRVIALRIHLQQPMGLRFSLQQLPHIAQASQLRQLLLGLRARLFLIRQLRLQLHHLSLQRRAIPFLHRQRGARDLAVATERHNQITKTHRRVLGERIGLQRSVLALLASELPFRPPHRHPPAITG